MKIKATISNKEKLKLYKLMIKIRLFEQVVFKLTAQGLVQGSVHFYIGEEAIASGVCFCLNKKDYIISSHRCHGHCIAKGGDIQKMLAELMGKYTGYCKGKGGTMHLVDPDIGMMGANGIVGGGIPIATGIGYACKNFERDRIVVSFFGDGAINTGAFHESLNLASVWKLPIIFVCENNQYAISTGVIKSTSIKDLSHRAVSYGIKGFNINGNNILEVVETTRKCIDIIKSVNGPILLICDTYRQVGHSIHDPRTYRTKEEEELWKRRDPIAEFEKILESENIINKLITEKFKNEIKEEINSALEFAKNSPKPELEELYKEVYA